MICRDYYGDNEYRYLLLYIEKGDICIPQVKRFHFREEYVDFLNSMVDKITYLELFQGNKLIECEVYKNNT